MCGANDKQQFENLAKKGSVQNYCYECYREKFRTGPRHFVSETSGTKRSGKKPAPGHLSSEWHNLHKKMRSEKPRVDGEEEMHRGDSEG